MNNRPKIIISTGIWVSILSFIIGTLFLLRYYLIDNLEMAFMAYVFIIVAGIVNIGVLLVLVFEAIKDKKYRKRYLKTSGLMLLNIPIVISYIYFFMVLSNTIRIKFINYTGQKIENIEVVGCQTKHIENLEINESKTCWIGITGNCSVRILYKIDGCMHDEQVFGYVTNWMGQKAKYRIGKDIKPIDENY